MEWRSLPSKFFALFEREKADPFRAFMEGMAKMIHSIEDMAPDWQRIEITRTEGGIKWATRPNLDLREQQR